MSENTGTTSLRDRGIHTAPSNLIWVDLAHDPRRETPYGRGDLPPSWQDLPRPLLDRIGELLDTDDHPCDIGDACAMDPTGASVGMTLHYDRERGTESAGFAPCVVVYVAHENGAETITVLCEEDAYVWERAITGVTP